MKINTETWHYKLWRKSFSHGEYIPDETDLCRYCHRVFWQVIGYAAFACMILALIGCALALLGMFVYKGLYQNTAVTLEVTAAIAVAVTLVVLYVRWLNRGKSYRRPQTLIGKYALASKQKVCPLVKFTSGEEE